MGGHPSMKATYAIPKPKTYGPLGHLPLLDKEAPIQSMGKIADEYGPVVQFDLPGRSQILISNYEAVADACDETRFDKKIGTALSKVRDFAGDGLFTSWTYEPNWQKAHNILLPSFSQQAMQGYHDMMVDIAVQLVQKWARLNPNESIDVSEDMTRLTLDTIGLCGFNYRFNSFYREQSHPFISSMVRALQEAMDQIQRLGLQDKLMVLTKRQYKQDITSMIELVDQIIAERKAQGNQGEKDLLSLMLEGKDPETGEQLSDENIRYQILTFLIAGHETTSGLLSFTLYLLLKHPDKLQKAYEEVDRVFTGSVPSHGQVRELKYIRMILNESLRLWPTAPAFVLYAKEDTLLANQYPIQKDDTLIVLVSKLHRDRAVWGDDVEEFRPERFEDPSKIPADAYKPFGNGQRACIGQQFALQEAALVLGMILKHFELVDHTNYQLKVKETLTLKPDGFTMQVKPRQLVHAVMAVSSEDYKKVDLPSSEQTQYTGKAHYTPFTVLFGSNLGTAEKIARDLAETAEKQGFVTSVKPLNDAIENVPREGVVVVVAASYNGRPTNNARKFVKWLETVQPSEFEGVHYAIFGCGDKNWASTYQQIPRMIDEKLSSYGAFRLTDLGEGDASGDFEKHLEDWKMNLWPAIMAHFRLEFHQSTHKKGSLSLQFLSGIEGLPLAANYGAQQATVEQNVELLLADSNRSTRHLEIRLPEGMSYREGDHLGILPQNPTDLIQRVLRRFGLNGNEQLVLEGNENKSAHLPVNRPVSLYDLLRNSVEIQAVVTRAQLRELARLTMCPPHKIELEAMIAEDVYQSEVVTKRISMLDLLEKYVACEMSFSHFLELLPPLKPRYYSISSSPMVQPTQASITVSVVKGEARSGQGEYRGIASNYLASLQVGDQIAVFVHTPGEEFKLPVDSGTSLILIGAGTGIAPYRGFLQNRRSQQKLGHRLGKVYLIFGCRNEQDFLYQEEWTRAEQEGLIQVYPAFSRKEGLEKTYVQHIVRDQAEAIFTLLEQGAQLYVCGDGAYMAPDVEATFISLYQQKYSVTEAEATAWLQELQKSGRYMKDVWQEA